MLNLKNLAALARNYLKALQVDLDDARAAGDQNLVEEINKVIRQLIEIARDNEDGDLEQDPEDELTDNEDVDLDPDLEDRLTDNEEDCLDEESDIDIIGSVGTICALDELHCLGEMENLLIDYQSGIAISPLGMVSLFAGTITIFS